MTNTGFPPLENVPTISCNGAIRCRIAMHGDGYDATGHGPSACRGRSPSAGRQNVGLMPQAPACVAFGLVDAACVGSPPPTLLDGTAP